MLKRIQQITTKIEPTDGALATMTGADAVQVYDPTAPVDDVAFLDRVPASPSLSRTNAPPGLTTRAQTWKEDFRGSGAIGTAPSFGRTLRAGGMQENQLIRITFTTGTSTKRFQIGESVTQSGGKRGICLTDQKGAAGDIVVYVIDAPSAFTTGTLTGDQGGQSVTVTVVSLTNEGFGYGPDSLRLIQWSSAAWTPSNPAAVGIILKVISGGFVVGAIQVVALGPASSWVSGVTGSLLWGTALSGNTLDDGAGNTTTLSADPTQLRTPSLSIGHNLDGFLRQTSGARIEWSLEGNGGEPLVFAMNARGRPAGKSAALTLSTSGLNAIRSPRLFGAFCGVGYLGQFYRFPVKSVKVSPNNKLVNRLDANQSGGLLSVQIADREPTIIVEFDQVGMAFDWISRRDNEENISFGCMLGGDGTGTYAGRTTSPSVARTMIIAAPNCQVAECPDGDQDGYATVQVTLKPRYLRDAGDDDLVLAMI